MPSFPCVENFLGEWWGGGGQGCNALAAALIADASNIVVGGNPLFQISDFLAFYPKFGVSKQAITALALNNIGSGYAVNDVLAILQDDASGATIKVSTVDGSGGITGFATIDTDGIGTGYRVANALPTSGGSGTGATVNITAITPYASSVNVPQVVLQTYITLACASLQYNRWKDLWRFGICLYVAHFLTMYLLSEGNPGTTAQQVASSGLETGIKIAQAAGDVSKSSQVLEGFEEWGSFRETRYGMQLITFAENIVPKSIYVF